MEKFGLFDLIDKFNAAAGGANDFSKKGNQPQTKEEVKPMSHLVDPQIGAPAQYQMNAKLLDFCKRHDELSRRITRSARTDK